MKRFHVHVAVSDLGSNVRFYSTVFGAPPDVLKGDYAKWMLEDPRVNFAISSRGAQPGLDHLGFQVDSDAELDGLRAQVAQADIAALDQPAAACCYARSDKYWTTDPQGIAWETFRTLGDIPMFGETAAPAAAGEPAAACCAPQAQAVALARGQSGGSQAAESQAAESQAAESQAAESQAAESQAVNPQSVKSQSVKSSCC